MGAHVSAVPNHQVGGRRRIETRAAVAFFGVFGYELDATGLSDQEREAIRDEIAFYQEHRELFQRGRFLRLRSPFEGDGNETAWMVADDDGRRAIVGYYQALNRGTSRSNRLRLRGLRDTSRYRVGVWPAIRDELITVNAGVRGGDELMRVGLRLDARRQAVTRRGDFWASLFVLEAID